MSSYVSITKITMFHGVLMIHALFEAVLSKSHRLPLLLLFEELAQFYHISRHSKKIPRVAPHIVALEPLS